VQRIKGTVEIKLFDIKGNFVKGIDYEIDYVDDEPDIRKIRENLKQAVLDKHINISVKIKGIENK
jgi:hypothetical protein